jgi:hypothetical protein
MPGNSELVHAYCPLAFTREAQAHEDVEEIKDMNRGSFDSNHIFTACSSMKTISQLGASIKGTSSQYSVEVDKAHSCGLHPTGLKACSLPRRK